MSENQMKVVKWKSLDDFLQKINQKKKKILNSFITQLFKKFHNIGKDFTAYILSLETFFKSYTFG